MIHWREDDKYGPEGRECKHVLQWNKVVGKAERQKKDVLTGRCRTDRKPGPEGKAAGEDAYQHSSTGNSTLKSVCPLGWQLSKKKRPSNVGMWRNWNIWALMVGMQKDIATLYGNDTAFPPTTV